MGKTGEDRLSLCPNSSSSITFSPTALRKMANPLFLHESPKCLFSESSLKEKPKASFALFFLSQMLLLSAVVTAGSSPD